LESAMNIIREFFLPPETESLEKNMRVRFLHITLWVSFFAMLVFAYLNYEPPTLLVSQAMFATAGICLIALYLNARGKYFLAAVLFTTVIIAINFYNLYDGISLHDAGILVFPIIVIFVGFLFGKNSIYPITIFNLATIFLLVYFERTGAIHPPYMTADQRLIIIVVLLVANAIIYRKIISDWELTLRRARESEKEVRVALEEVSKIRNELEARVQDRTLDLQKANKELEAFSYSVSHDLRAPLRAINGFVSILVNEYQDKLDDDGRNYLERVRISSQRMNQLIDDMLQLSQVGRREIVRREIQIGILARETFSKLAEQEEGRHIEFALEDCPNVNADRNLVEILLTNLLSNSVKFTKNRQTAHIEMGALDKDREDVFFIRDNGVGFDMEFADKLFSPFQRLHSHDEYEGTGIGLAIVHRIIQRHNGRVWLESKVDEGTTVYFTFGD
jgi:signal transduction histidine kinase